MVVLAELAAGAALILGIRVRLAAALALLMVVNFHVASDDIFPAVTGTWILDELDMQLRASFSETISRPDFRELSPSPFTHPVTGY